MFHGEENRVVGVNSPVLMSFSLPSSSPLPQVSAGALEILGGKNRFDAEEQGPNTTYMCSVP